MAIGTYAELQTAVANWLDRDDLTNRITEFITLCETRFNRELRIRAMETTATDTTVAGTRSYALPTGYLQGRVFSLNTTPITMLEYLAPEMMDRLWAGSRTGKPLAYTIVGNNYNLGPGPDAAYTVELVYYKSFDALSDSATTSTMLTNNPDVYLYGSLLEAEPFLQNDARVGLWLQAYKEAIKNISDADARDRHSGSALRIITTSGNP
jgi:hypothetical protein|tara:strand:+ start:526 stop:1152 length:627 start_codon:yes stop_codon:yes gene_type:complete